LESRYREMVKYAFLQNWKEGATVVDVTKEDLLAAAAAKGFAETVNSGDAIYDARSRSGLHKDVEAKAPPGTIWVILGAGRGKYRFVALDPQLANITPSVGQELIKIPDSTPELIRRYALDDEQALLARLRYNRLLDIFLGVACYSLQNHLRTTVEDIGQIEVDELYVGVNATGTTFVMPVEAKVGKERLSVVQAWQGLELCQQKFAGLIARPVAATFISGQDTIAMIEFAAGTPVPVVRKERHYRLVPASDISTEDLQGYREAYEGAATAT
jgi:hypothetical protein